MLPASYIQLTLYSPHISSSSFFYNQPLSPSFLSCNQDISCSERIRPVHKKGKKEIKMASDAPRPQNGDSTPTNSSRFQQLLSEKLNSLRCSLSPSGSAATTACDGEPDETREAQSQAFVSPAPYNFTFSTTPSQASIARRHSGPSLPPAASSPRVNPFENGYIGSAKRGPEARDGSQESKSEPATKRAKKSPTVAPGPDCTCSISTTCARAAANCVRDCRLTLISIPKRPKPARNSNNNKPG